MMKRLILIGLTAALVFGCSGKKGPGESEFDRDMALLDQFKFDEAGAKFDELGKANPTLPIGLLGSAESSERQIEYYDALHYYMSIDGVDSTLPRSFIGAVRVLMRLEYYYDATEEAGRFVRRFPDDPRSHFWLARACMRSGNYGRARTEAHLMDSLGAAAGVARVITAQAWFMTSDFDSAAVILDSALTTKDRSAEFYEVVADYFELADQADSSIAYSRLYVDAGNRQPAYLMEHFHRALRLGWFDEADHVIQELAEKDAPPIVTNGLRVFFQLAHDDKIEARNTAVEYRRFAGDCISASFYEMLARGRIGESMQATQETMFMRTIMTRGNYDQRFQDLLNFRIVVFMQDQDAEFATLKELETVKAEYRNRWEISLEKLHLLYRTGQKKEGDQLAKTLIEFHETSPEWMLHIGDVFSLSDVHFYDRAEQSYRTALESNPWYRPAFKRFVEMYLTSKRPKKALGLFDKYPELEARFPSIAALKAYCQIVAGQAKEGVAAMDSYLEVHHGDFRICRRAYEALNRAGELTLMKDLAEALQKNNPESYEGTYLAWDLLYDSYDTTGAYDAARKLVELKPKDPRAIARNAYSMHMEGDSDSAAQALEQLILDNRENSEVNLWLSRLLADEGRDLQRASNLARKASNNSYMKYRNWMNLCYVYYVYGRADLCRGEAAKASRKFTDRPLPYYWMGMAMNKEGKKDARDQLQKAIDLGLRGPELEQAKSIIASLK